MKNIIKLLSRSFIKSTDGKLFTRGFTLIEMMVVIAIISILTAIIMTNFSGAKAKARDAKRISDLGNIQLALELYFDRCNAYPKSNVEPVTGEVTLTNGGTEEDCMRKKPDNTYYTMSDFIASIPTPPSGSVPDHYMYFSSDNMANPGYVLEAVLETPSEVIKDGLNDNIEYGLSGGMPFWMLYYYNDTEYQGLTCSNMPTSLTYCIGPK